MPLLIAPAYFGCDYLAWSLAHVFVGVFGNKLRAEQIWRVPLVAAFVMVMWDLTMDPIAATVQKQWIWHDGGSYFGVPFVNYLGWLLCVYTIFQLFSIYISRQSVASAQEEQSHVHLPRLYLHLGQVIRQIEGTGIKLRPHTRLRVLPGRYLR